MSDDVTLRPMRWWDVERLLPLERELFGSEAWSAETWWGELAHVGEHGGRWYVVAEPASSSGVAGESRGLSAWARVPSPAERVLSPAERGRSPAEWGLSSSGAEQPELVGYAGVGVNGPDADVMTVAVSPAAQGSGLGGRLLEALIDHAREAGASQVLLEVRADNEPAQRLYRRRGFEQIARRTRYYGDADGLVMRLRPLPTT